MSAISTARPRVHGGPDARGAVPHDFSTNANACGPCPDALKAVAGADPARYPDPDYAVLRQALARHHGVEPTRIVLAGSASEFIFRITACAVRMGLRSAWIPAHAYGDYAAAAQAWGLGRAAAPLEPGLAWACEPSSPHGAADVALQVLATRGTPGLAVLDRAYEPLRLAGAPSLGPAQLDRLWQLWTPNKALGLTGVRAAYAVAPVDAPEVVAAVEALAASWVLGAHGTAMLQAWCDPAVQEWLEGSRPRLLEWKLRQTRLCERLGWTVLPGDANYFVCRTGLAPDAMAHRLGRLRGAGIRLRDCSSFGLPGYLRLGVRPPASQDALEQAMEGMR